jgi:integrase/recombinase XerD
LLLAKALIGTRLMTKQAKTLTQPELRRVLDYISTRPHAARNRAMVVTTYLSGMRVGEIASLRLCDVVDMDGKVRDEIRLTAEQTKGRYARTVFINTALKKELSAYVLTLSPPNNEVKLFYTQKRPSEGFTANTLCQFFHYLYKRAGIAGASSHSGRRSFITNLAAKGVGVRVLMGLAGHRSLAVTQRYIDANDEMLRRAAELA